MNVSIVETILTSGATTAVIGGIFVIVKHIVPTPVTKNQELQLIQQFTTQLLEQARLEREELRLSIRTLEQTVETSAAEVEKLRRLCAEKDRLIILFETRHRALKFKHQQGLAFNDLDFIEESEKV